MAVRGKVVDLRSARGHRADYGALACGRFAALCRAAGLPPEELARHITAAIGMRIAPEIVEAWQSQSPPPSTALLALEDLTRGEVPTVAGPGLLLDRVPHSFPADVLTGPWVTAYQFLHHGTETRCHADIATVTAVSDRRVRAANHPPEPRSEGRASGFRNEIEAELVGRHLVGTWKNTSDTRYYGAVQLAVLPGETAMEGHFTGVASDVHVSTGHWKWVRLDAPGVDLAGVSLRSPPLLYDLVMARSQDDAPLTLADVREDDQ